MRKTNYGMKGTTEYWLFIITEFNLTEKRIEWAARELWRRGLRMCAHQKRILKQINARNLNKVTVPDDTLSDKSLRKKMYNKAYNKIYREKMRSKRCVE